MSKLVSILIPCFNAERWIGPAVESALAQTYMSTEIIVFDDGSTDGSLEVLRHFGQHIHWETGPNRGANVTRNRLLSLSRGSWLQYLHGDDYLVPDKIEPQMEFVAEYPDADVIYSPIVIESWPRSPGAATTLLSRNRTIHGSCSSAASCRALTMGITQYAREGKLATQLWGNCVVRAGSAPKNINGIVVPSHHSVGSAVRLSRCFFFLGCSPSGYLASSWEAFSMSL